MSLQSRFVDHILAHDLFHHGDKLIVAVSGGVDSIVLAELCHRAGFDIMLAHCNFNLRKEEVKAEEELVNRFAGERGLQCEVIEFETEAFAELHKLSIQVAARQLRYDWFRELLNETGRNYILTAHHANDNVETLLMNFFKGTGIRGLGAIAAKQDHLIRPLLFAKRRSLNNSQLSITWLLQRTPPMLQTSTPVTISVTSLYHWLKKFSLPLKIISSPIFNVLRI